MIIAVEVNVSDELFTFWDFSFGFPGFSFPGGEVFFPAGVGGLSRRAGLVRRAKMTRRYEGND